MDPLFKKGALLLRWGALALFLASVASAQAPPPLQPKLYVYWLLPGDKAWNWQTVILEAPLTLTRDSAGVAHLSTPTTTVDEEVPSGSLDGINTVFTLANEPSPASSLQLYINGLRMHSGVDFTLTGNTITLIGFIPGPGQNIVASYRCLVCTVAPPPQPVTVAQRTAISSESQLSRTDVSTNVPMAQAVITKPAVADYTGTVAGCSFVYLNDEVYVNQPGMACNPVPQP